MFWCNCLESLNVALGRLLDCISIEVMADRQEHSIVERRVEYVQQTDR